MLRSLREQTLPAAQVRIWHNGPRFDETLGDYAADVELSSSGCNLGFGAGHNRLFDGAAHALSVLVNPDCRLDVHCLERLQHAMSNAPRAVLGAAALKEAGAHERVNAYAQRLTFDLLGINTDRGRAYHELSAPAELRQAPERYLGPSGALFAISRPAWAERVGGKLFPESLFLYLEDVALALKVRRAGGEVCFCPEAWAEHQWSQSTGQRSALKLYHVERNRLWLARALWGTSAATALLAFTGARYAAYLASSQHAGLGGADAWQLRRAAWRALKDGYAELPQELVAYLDLAQPQALSASFFATLRQQLRNPLTLSEAERIGN